MKKYKLQVKVNKLYTAMEVTSPTGTTIDIHMGQTGGIKMETFKLIDGMISKGSGTFEVTADQMRSLLEVSKRKNLFDDDKGKENVRFTKFGKYYSFIKNFTDDKHRQNYINKMVDNGYSYVGID